MDGATRRGLLERFANDERGATAIEYALIAGFVGAVIASTILTLGDSIKTKLYDRVAAIF